MLIGPGGAMGIPLQHDGSMLDLLGCRLPSSGQPQVQGVGLNHALFAEKAPPAML